MLERSHEPPQINTLGGRIRAVRVALNMRLGGTANKIGISRTSLGQWEADAVKNPDVDKLAAFSKLTDVSLDWLIDGRGDTPTFLAAPRRGPKPAQAATGTDSSPPSQMPTTSVPEIAPALTMHAKGLDMTPQAHWTFPLGVLELGFHVEAPNAALMRVASRDSAEAGLARGDFVVLDISRTRIDEPGIYLLADPDGGSARRVRVESVDNELRMTMLDIAHDNPQPVTDKITVLGRVMGVFKPV